MPTQAELIADEEYWKGVAERSAQRRLDAAKYLSGKYGVADPGAYWTGGAGIDPAMDQRSRMTLLDERIAIEKGLEAQRKAAEAESNAKAAKRDQWWDARRAERENQLQSARQVLNDIGLSGLYGEYAKRINSEFERPLSRENTINYDLEGATEGFNTDEVLQNYVANERMRRRDLRLEEAKAKGADYLKNLGLDDRVVQDFNNQLAYKAGVTGTNANDYTGVFNSVAEQVANAERDRRRTQYTTAVRGGLGDPSLTWNDTADDAVINSILGSQKTETTASLDAALKRGMINDKGYQAGLGRLGQMEAAGRSTANTLGGAVLSGYRDDLSEAKTNALNAASNYTFGDKFDANAYLDNYAKKQAGQQASLAGDVTNALSGQKFFDIGEILGSAGRIQGPANTRGTPGDLFQPFAPVDARAKENKRGLEGAGVF